MPSPTPLYIYIYTCILLRVHTITTLRPLEQVSMGVRDHQARFSVFVSYVELYNDKIYDLLDEGPTKEDGLRVEASSSLADANLSYPSSLFSSLRLLYSLSSFGPL